jgi:prepilin-type N-terminal cleavage/methylation domain-containing protein
MEQIIQVVPALDHHSATSATSCSLDFSCGYAALGPLWQTPRFSKSECGIAVQRRAFSLVELMAVVAILGVLAALIVPRVIGHYDSAKRTACFANQAEIELQTKLWLRTNGSYPAGDLSNIGASTSYFPEGVPSCPVDGSAYTIDTTSGLVIGHTH